MNASVAVSIAVQTLTGALPDGVKKALESQLPAWSQVSGNPAPSSESEERIAVERSTGSTIAVFLVERKMKLAVLKEDDNYWLTEVVWCGAGEGRCDDVWKRTDAQWRSDNATANHTGYAVYRDSLRLSPNSWTNPVPSLAFGKKTWDKGLCESGMCFAVSAKDSSVARGAVRGNGTVVWWDGGYILGGALEKEMVHAYRYLLDMGKAVPARK